MRLLLDTKNFSKLCQFNYLAPKFFYLSLAVATLGYAFDPYSNTELDNLEQQFIQQINQSDSILRDPLATQYLNQIGTQLAASTAIRSYFFIVKSKEINAFAGPGGYIGINTALILTTSNESELAAVMAHELAHVYLHHLYRLIEHEKHMQVPMLATLLASAAIGLINPTLGSGAMAASLTGFSQNSINFTRANEKEADSIGINLLSRAGYDPQAMAGFFKKMQQITRYYFTGDVPAILRTHPLDEDRIARAENRSLTLAKKNVPTSLDYVLFKTLVNNAANANTEQQLNYYQHQCQSNHSLACEYGYALAQLNSNHYLQAKNTLLPLVAKMPTNLFLHIAMAQAEFGCKNYLSAFKRLDDLAVIYPNNYAILMTRAQGLLAQGDAAQAVHQLLKSFRLFKKNKFVCDQLAYAQAQAGHKSYAYFTQAQCHILSGRMHDALRQLTLVKRLAKHDRYLSARADAMIEAIKS